MSSPLVVDPQIAPVTIDQCPLCQRSHTFKIRWVFGPPVIVLGGRDHPAGNDVTPERRNVELRCPITGRAFTMAIETSVPAGRVLESVAEVTDEPAAEAGATQEPAADREMAEWVTRSVDKGVDYLRTIGAAAAAFIPAYFAVLAYLGPSGLTGAWRVAALVCPLLMLATVVLCFNAQRPRARVIAGTSDFATFRNQRLLDLSNWVRMTTLSFAAGLAAAIAVWSYLTLT